MGRMEGYCTWNDEGRPVLYLDGALPTEYTRDFIPVSDINPPVSSTIGIDIRSPYRVVLRTREDMPVCELPIPGGIVYQWRHAVDMNHMVAVITSCRFFRDRDPLPTGQSLVAFTRTMIYEIDDGIGAMP